LENTFPGSRECIRLGFLRRGVPQRALDTLLASLADSTIRQYSKPLRDWWAYCQATAVSPFDPSPSQFLAFLAQVLEQSSSYSTINTSRSAISLITHNSIGNHALINRFCKGAGVLKPPRPRYDFVWDPAPVLAKLGTLFPYDSLPLETITKKMVLLLALATGQRAQTLALFKLSQISMGDKLTIRVPDRVKTSAPGRPQPFFSFSPFIDSENLCVYGIVKHYLTITQDLRNSSGDSFFISFVRPHRAVGQQTISRWLRLSLSDCGVKSDLLSSHSTRHAATSLAARKGVPLDLIKRAAGWSGSSQVFARFYNRPIIDPEEFSSAVLRA